MIFPRLSDALRTRIRFLEWIVAALVTACIVVLHFVNLTHAGGLWRDEASAVSIALLPSFGEVWAHLEYDSFPLLFFALLRGWSAMNLGESDLALRVFGLLAGLAVLAVIWWNAWRLSSTPPLLSILLFGLSPVVIRWGDSLRAYGLGVLFILLSLGLVWRVVRSPSPRNMIMAMAAGILAVQSLYQNAVVLGVICLGGVVVAARRRAFGRALVVVAVLLPAALSLLPYLGVVRRASDWNVTTQMPIDLPRIWLVLHRALSDPSPLMLWLWAALLVAAVIAGCLLLAGRKRPHPLNEEDKEIGWFLLTVIVAITIAFYAFLRILNFPTEVWYYLVWMGIVAVAMDALLARAIRESWARAIRLGSVVIALPILLPGVWRGAQVRMTNLDFVAQRLNQETAREDMVLVHPWFCGATLNRYYAGGAAWATLPPLADYRMHRLDLFKGQMQLENPIQPLLEKIESTLRGGHTVWLVGYIPFSHPPRPPPKLPRAGEGPEGWRGSPYMVVYGMEVAYFIQAHALTGTPMDLPSNQKVNPFENLPVRAVSGWRSSRF